LKGKGFGVHHQGVGCLLKARADSHGAERAVEELVEFHLAAALLAGGHHQEVQLFARERNEHLGEEVTALMLQFVRGC
jgi:hypothetical protein